MHHPNVSKERIDLGWTYSITYTNISKALGSAITEVQYSLMKVSESTITMHNLCVCI